MILLVGIVDEHPIPLNYDLMRCGARLRDWPDNGVTWGDLLTIVDCAQPDSAVYKALNPQWRQTVESDFLRSAELSLRTLLWLKTTDAKKGRSQPEPWLWPWEELPDETIAGDSMTVEEAAHWLGWEQQMRDD